MATKEQVKALLDRLKKALPSQHFQNIDKNVAGIRAILKFLNETEDKVTAGRFSALMRSALPEKGGALSMSVKKVLCRQNPLNKRYKIEMPDS